MPLLFFKSGTLHSEVLQVLRHLDWYLLAHDTRVLRTPPTKRYGPVAATLQDDRFFILPLTPLLELSCLIMLFEEFSLHNETDKGLYPIFFYK